jgi:glycosyltransferase involved in cell wall biosynthesis
MKPSNAIPSISVVMPAFNEERILEQSVVATVGAFEELGLDTEVLIVDDYSSDATGEIANALEARFSTVRTFFHSENQGIGGAFRTGVENAQREYILLIPVDNPLDVIEIEAFVERMKICDVVVGVRAKRVGYSPFALFASFVYNRILVPLLFNIGFSDVNWIQAYRRSLFEEKVLKITFTGIFFLVEVLIRAKRAHLVIVEVPSKMHRRLYGKPTNSKLITICAIFRDMMIFYYEINFRSGQR